MCQTLILINDEIWPIPKPGEPQYTLWVHLACAKTAGPLVRPPCPHLARKGVCAYRESCFFTHPFTDPDSPTSLHLTASEMEHKGVAFETGRSCNTKKSTWQKNKNNQNKCGVFRRWLVDTFGATVLQGGQGVLDIAGGKGELSFELLNLADIPCTVVDPRELRVDKYKRRLSLGVYSSNPSLSSYLSDGYWQRTKQLTPTLTPNHLKIFFDSSVIDWVGTKVETKENKEDCAADNGMEQVSFFQRALRTASEAVLVGESPIVLRAQCAKKNDGSKDMDARPAHRIVADTDAIMVLQSCSVVLGLHLDGAAEAAVDFALRFNKPFAIVPCCTCSKQFPRRVLVDVSASGIVQRKPVKTYEDLVEYLSRKDPRIKSATLNFGGKNKVLYLLPDL